MKKIFVTLASFAVMSLVLPTAANAATTLTFDNDAFTGSDNKYTNGLGFTWVSKDINTYGNDSFVNQWGRFWSFLPFVGDDGYQTYVSWSVAQEMYTANDIEDRDPAAGDHPYAGILYVDNVIYARKENWAHVWQLKTGLVGPDSYADETQKGVHHVIGSAQPQGWHTQMPNEPIVNVGYTVAHKVAEGNLGASTKWRVIPVGSVGLGTYFTGASLGAYGEFGWNLVDAFGGTALRDGFNAASTVGVGPVKGWSVALFGGFGGYAVARYLPLDGTFFRDSRSVDTKPFIGMSSMGITVRHSRFVAALAVTHFTKMYDTEPQRADFGTLSLSTLF